MKKNVQIKLQFYTHLGQQFQSARISQGLTVEQAAEYMGIKKEKIEMMEKGEPQYLTNLRLGAILGLFMSYGKNPRLIWDNLLLKDKPHHLASYTSEELKMVIDERMNK